MIYTCIAKKLCSLACEEINFDLYHLESFIFWWSQNNILWRDGLHHGMKKECKCRLMVSGWYTEVAYMRAGCRNLLCAVASPWHTVVDVWSQQWEWASSRMSLRPLMYKYTDLCICKSTFLIQHFLLGQPSFVCNTPGQNSVFVNGIFQLIQSFNVCTGSSGTNCSISSLVLNPNITIRKSEECASNSNLLTQ